VIDVAKLRPGDLVLVRPAVGSPISGTRPALFVVLDASSQFAAVVPAAGLNVEAETARIAGADIVAVYKASAVDTAAVPARQTPLDLAPQPAPDTAAAVVADVEPKPELVMVSVPDAARTAYEQERRIIGRHSQTIRMEPIESDHVNRHALRQYEADLASPVNRRKPPAAPSNRVVMVDKRDLDVFLGGVHGSYVVGDPQPIASQFDED